MKVIIEAYTYLGLVHGSARSRFDRLISCRFRSLAWHGLNSSVTHVQ